MNLQQHYKGENIINGYNNILNKLTTTEYKHLTDKEKMLISDIIRITSEDGKALAGRMSSDRALKLLKEPNVITSLNKLVPKQSNKTFGNPKSYGANVHTISNLKQSENEKSKSIKISSTDKNN